MSPQAGFLLLNEVVPRLKSAIPHVASFVGSEDAEELIQDATAIAARLLHSAEAAGKKVTSGNIAYYAIQHLKSGRRSTGSSAVDVMHSGTQLKGRAQLSSLEALSPLEDETNESLALGEVLSNDHDDPGTIVARKLDWEAFCRTQPARNRSILECTAQGGLLTEVAQKHRVSNSAIHADKQVLSRNIREFLGADILQQSMQAPLWRSNLMASAQRGAWRKQRGT